MTPRSNERTVKKGWFLYDGQTRCGVEIIQTDFRPGVDDDEEPQADAHGEFYRIQYAWPNQFSKAGGGYFENLTDAMRAAEQIVREIHWE